MDTKNYTPVARSKIHTCAKFGVDCLNGATCIVNITDKQTNERAIGDCVLAKISKNDDQADDYNQYSSILMIKQILKFRLVIMILSIIVTHLRKYALLYHVPWYHCTKQE